MIKIRSASLGLLGALFWFIACSGSGDRVDSTPGTIGSSCDADRDCGFSSLTCGPEGRCVECVDDGDCTGSESCVEGRCEAPSASGGAGPSGGSGGSEEGGAVSSGGASGGADGAGGDAPISICPPGMIDDFEDGNEHVCEHEGRQGDWDGGDSDWGATLDPPRGDSLRGAVLHVPAGDTSTFSLGFDDWLPYDASQYVGLQLFTKSSTPVGYAVNVQTQATRGTSEGGNCELDCVDNLSGVTADKTWKLQRLPFAELVGGSSILDPSELTGVFFVIAGERDVWIDDVSFYLE